MDVRVQQSMVFHLDKCIGCHTCSIACKNIWTDRRGTEYMWWNNVETKPGTGYPTAWEDQEKYYGGWEVNNGKPNLKSTSKLKVVANIFHHPHMPSLDDYYHPWTYKYEDLFNAPEGEDQPTARPISMITGEYIDIEAGPNWDDDLSGSEIYARNDPNMSALTQQQRDQLFAVEKLVFFYFPRICNHCLNPACVASCPSGALHKRGEDGIVLVDQKLCRAWRSCISACPYKKVYFNWHTGKSEKCILCFPRLEIGEAQACFHSCVGRIRYTGVLLYDAEQIERVASLPEDQLIDGQREMILDPHDPEVIKAALDNGIHPSVIDSAQKSPVYKWVIKWGMALPPHGEFRTLPMLFYVPPMSPVVAERENPDSPLEHVDEAFFHDIENSRIPIEFLANLLGVGSQGKIRYALKKQKAVRWYRRAITAGDVDMEKALRILHEADCTPEEAEEIYHLTTLAPYTERFEIAPSHREEAIEQTECPQQHKQEAGFGFLSGPRRGL